MSVETWTVVARAVDADAEVAQIAVEFGAQQLTVSIPIRRGEPPEHFRARLRERVRRAIEQKDAGRGRRARFLQALQGLTQVTVERPGAPLAAVAGGVLSGEVSAGTAICFLIVREANGSERECHVVPSQRPNPNGLHTVSVDLGGRIAVRLIPLGAEGIEGPAQDF